MNSYLRRALKYLLYMLVLLAIIFTLMELTRTGNFERFSEVFFSQRGLLLLAMIVLLGLFYPKFGFVKREVKADLKADRDKIERAFQMSGYELRSQQEGELIFRAKSPVKRLMFFDEEAIRVAPDDNYITIEGIRKEVVKVEFRLKGLLGA